MTRFHAVKITETLHSIATAQRILPVELTTSTEAAQLAHAMNADLQLAVSS